MENLNEKQQIEEMANILWHIPHGYSLNSYNDCEIIAECIYNDGGYRKQSEGEWIEQVRVSKEGKPLLRHYKCNLCGVYLATQANFCPNCGARMKGGAEE